MIFLGCVSAFAQSTSTSASYALLHAPAGDLGGGGRVTNAGATVTADISVGDPASGAVSTVTAGGAQAKGNLIGQLSDVKTFAVSASPPTVNENSTRQLTAQAAMDDATTLNPAATNVTWFVQNGPVWNINLNGLASTGPVLGPTSARVNGTFQGVTDADGFVLNVLDTGESDNFQTYGGDGIDDGWQTTHFGLPPNANAAANADPDGDGRNNRFEFLSGFTPTDAASFFQFTITGFSSPAVMDFRLNKVIPGRTYTLQESANLTSPFAPIGSFSVSSEETNKLVQDTAAPAGRNFYQIEIAKP